MARNLDLTALRSLVAVADEGKVTAAAARQTLTHSAVSRQLTRWEEALGQPLLDRAGRGVALTSEGELLLGYARRMVQLNDEIWNRMTHADFEGELTLGVPHDIVYPHIPQAMRRFARDFPRVKVTLTSSFTRRLKEEFNRGEIDLILTTEAEIAGCGETLDESWLVWVGAHGGSAWRSRPVKLAYERNCIFRTIVQRALEGAGLEWEMAVESDQTRPVEAAVSADLAIHTQIASSIPPYFEEIQHGGALPDLPPVMIGMYLGDGPKRPLIDSLAEMIRATYGLVEAPRRMAAE
ncbi:MAG: LysR family transcriptional regulator [Pikeienuella sp.]